MANETKVVFLKELNKRYGAIRKVDRSQSLYEIGDGAARVYVRYSRVHSKDKAFYGLRKEDLQKLEGILLLFAFYGTIRLNHYCYRFRNLRTYFNQHLRLEMVNTR